MKVSPEMDQDGVKNSRRIYFFGRKKHILSSLLSKTNFQSNEKY